MTYARFGLWLILLPLLWQIACGPEESSSPQPSAPVPSVPENKSAPKFDFDGALVALVKLDKLSAQKNNAELVQKIREMTQSFHVSFPLLMPKPFSLHSLHDLLMKNTKNLSTATVDTKQAWQKLLDEIELKTAFNGTLKFKIDTSVARSVLAGTTPTLTTELRNDFTGFTNEELATRNSISYESFWQPAFLYDSGSGTTKERDTGAVIMFHNKKMVAILEFKNRLTTAKVINLASQNDLIYVLPKTPGYISSVGRRAAFARFGIGNKLFEEFFKYARTHGIKDSYLHVRKDNDSAISLYKSLGYTVVADIPVYYQDPPIGAHVMHKRL